MRARAAACALALVSLFAMWSRSAPAQGDAEPGAPAVVALCREALAHAKKHEFEAARVLYAKAFDTAPSAAILFNLALSELNSDHALEALRHFREYLSARDTEDSKVALVRSDLLPKTLAATGHVQLQGSPPEATLFLDGQRIVEAAGGVVDVAPGKHVVTARVLTGMGEEGWRAEVNASPGATTGAVFKLLWVRSSSPAATADGGAGQVDAGLRR